MKRAIQVTTVILALLAASVVVVFRRMDQNPSGNRPDVRAKPDGGTLRHLNHKQVSERGLPARLFREKAVAIHYGAIDGGALGMLGEESQPVAERVAALQAMRGVVLSNEERGRAIAFLDGQTLPAGLPSNEIHWMADELLTVLRLQNPP